MQIPCEVIGEHARPVQSIAAAPEGRLLLTGDTDRQLIAWKDGVEAYRLDLRTRVAKAVSNDRIRSIAFAPDGSQFYVASGPTVQAFRAQDGKRIWSYSLPRFLGFLIAIPLSIDVEPEGRIAITNDNGTFGIRDALGRKHRIWRHNAAPRWIRWASDGNSLLGSDSFSIRQWDAATGETIFGYRTEERVYGFDASKSTPLFAVRTLHGLQIYRIGEGTPATILPVAEGLPLVAFGHKKPIVAVSTEHQVSVLQVSGDGSGVETVFTTEPLDAAVLSIGFSGDDRTLLVGATDGRIRAYSG